MTSLLPVLAIPVVVTLAGGLAAVWWRPGDRTRSRLQHFAAGVVTAAFAVELVPEIEASHASAWVTLGSFAAGGALMFCLKWIFVRLEERRRGPRRPLGLFVATGVDVLMDGLVIGTGYASSREVGASLAVGLSAELLFLGLGRGARAGAGRPGGRGVAVPRVPPLLGHPLPDGLSRRRVGSAHCRRL